MKRTARIGSPGFQRVRQRLEYWRRTHWSPARIPKDLWDQAVEISKERGVSSTSRALGLSYQSLKKRAEEASSMESGAKGGGTNFFELAPLPSIVGQECLIELEDGRGTRMKIQIKGVQSPDLVSLTRTLWRDEP